MRSRNLICSLQIIVPAILLTLLTYLAGSLLLGGVAPVLAAGERGQPLFDQKCKSCHTIGGGKTVGPDLKGVAAQRDRDWLVKFIATPDRLIAGGDPLARQLVQQYGLPMPNVGVSEEDAREIIAYMEAQSGGAQAIPLNPPLSKGDNVAVTAGGGHSAGVSAIPLSPPFSKGEMAQPVDPALVRTGRAMFTGEIPFKNGGPSCLSCHNAAGVSALGGGTLARDLTKTYASLGDQGTAAVIKAAPFPLMKDIYGARPLTDDEVASLTAFLQDASQQTTPSPPSPFIIIIGVAGAVVGVILFQLFWRGRLPAVRRPLVNGESK
ncbi:MAG: cytochrome c [Chloroflexi bacterium]|nr:cytochrome c [Chloroflexota bacterium]